MNNNILRKTLVTVLASATVIGAIPTTTNAGLTGTPVEVNVISQYPVERREIYQDEDFSNITINAIVVNGVYLDAYTLQGGDYIGSYVQVISNRRGERGVVYGEEAVPAISFLSLESNRSGIAFDFPRGFVNYHTGTEINGFISQNRFEELFNNALLLINGEPFSARDFWDELHYDLSNSFHGRGKFRFFEIDTNQNPVVRPITTITVTNVTPTPVQATYVNTPTSTTEDRVLEFEREILRHINDFRASQGLHPLILHELASDVAREHSRDIIINGNLHGSRHIGSNGSRPSERLLEIGLFGGSENVAGAGYVSSNQNIFAIAETIVNGWINSEGHRRNLLIGVTHIGIGYSTNGVGGMVTAKFLTI
ncbi:MAG: CAP domain-containing protein [Defluviitaleaceae bacterium]|nr:CAP domain-containing protein [Defluviitaleaceae bacterium]